MLRCMYAGISGMKVNQTKLDVIGNNIANVGTTSFKASSARFRDMLYQNTGEATSVTATKGGTNAKQVGLGAQVSSINKVMGQGNALSTGRSLDVCIDGDGYLLTGSGFVDYSGGNNIDETTNSITPATGADKGVMDILYTRDGNLTLDSQGNLLTADGRRVMGYAVTDGTQTTSIDPTSGKILSVNADAVDKTTGKSSVAIVGANGTDTKLVPLKVPDTVYGSASDTAGQPVKKFEIGKDGLITVILGDGSRAAVGQIALASFKNPEGLISVGGNLLQKSANSGPEIIRNGVGTDGTTDNSKGFGDFIQGALEGSNVDLTEQFTDMITATRSFQAASKMVTTGDEILQTITGLMR
ncbi:flagellar hook-basal body complex protein [Clostridium chromiireducens]|uniref:Flagellar hook protein FlgE n=1 Tax=Clostridium chromiireducens TaxID=225345 RepID=A0A399IT39_9CLOT|nr:flagellar hook-basal body complex protein [Clostridium chromiireducens]RII36174.1 flagellar hook-basal body complex protein [Clostridium chromiireducens]